MSGITDITELALSKFFQEHSATKDDADAAAKTLVEHWHRGELQSTLEWIRLEMKRDQ